MITPRLRPPRQALMQHALVQSRRDAPKEPTDLSVGRMGENKHASPTLRCKRFATRATPGSAGILPHGSQPVLGQMIA